MRWPQANLPDLEMGMSSEPQVRQEILRVDQYGLGIERLAGFGAESRTVFPVLQVSRDRIWSQVCLEVARLFSVTSSRVESLLVLGLRATRLVKFDVTFELCSDFGREWVERLIVAEPHEWKRSCNGEN